MRKTHIKISDLENKVFCSDNLKKLKKIPQDSIDLVVTDPPYNVGKDYGVYKDNLPEEEYLGEIEKRVIEISRVLKQRGSLYLSTSQLMIWKVKTLIEKHLRFNRVLIWYHPNNMTNFYGTWVRTYEPFLFFSKGKPHRLNNIYPINAYDVMIYAGTQRNFIQDKKLHITQKPLKLILKIVAAASQENDLILDPWMGSGTICVAAKILKRRYIGIDINPKFCEIAKNRLSKVIYPLLQKQTDIFKEARCQRDQD